MGIFPRLSEPQFPHPQMGMIMAACEVIVRMKKNVSSKCPAITSVLTVPLSSPSPKLPGEPGPPSPRVTTAAQGCLTMTLGDQTLDSQVAHPASSAPLSQSFSPSQRHEAGTHLWLEGPQLSFSAGHTCLAVGRDTYAQLSQGGHRAWCQ